MRGVEAAQVHIALDESPGRRNTRPEAASVVLTLRSGARPVDAGDQGFSPASSTGRAAHAAGLLVELLLNAAAVRSDRPPLLRTT